MTPLVPEAEPAHSPDTTRSAHPSKLRLLLPIVLLVAGVGAATWYVTSRPKADVLSLSGRIEGYPTNVGTKVAGRIEQVTVREGDRVQQGQLIVQLDDDEIQAQLQGATARLAAAQQQVRQAQIQVDVILNQIQEAQLTVEQAQGESRGRIYQAEASVAAAEAQLNQSQALVNQSRSEVGLARRNRDRFAQLWQEGAITRQQLDQAETTLASAQATLQSREAAVEAARRQVNALQGGLTQAETSGLNPEIRRTQVAARQRQLNVALAQVETAQAEVKSAQAARQQILAQMAYLKVQSPIAGIVLTRSVEPGEVVTVGKTLLTIINPDQIYMRGFIPEGQIGKVHLGQAARVYLDSAPKTPLEAEVAAIDTQAAFTPENIYFKEDRVRQVFGVRLDLKRPAGLAKPGMPADAEIIPDSEPRP